MINQLESKRSTSHLFVVMAKKDSKVIRMRNTIIIFVTAVVIMILGFGTYVSTPLSKGEIEAADYQEIANPTPRRPGTPIKVVEFFSYLCVHCRNFDPVLDEWQAEQPDDVAVSRLPTTWGPIQGVLSQTYIALEAAEALENNHTRIFRAIHDAKRQFLTPEMVGDYVDGHGITRDEFLKHFDSPRVTRAFARAKRLQQQYDIRATPTLVVGGRYLVGMDGGQGRALEVVEYLINKIRNEESGAAS